MKLQGVVKPMIAARAGGKKAAVGVAGAV